MAAIPDGTLCLIYRAHPDHQHCVGRSVVVTYAAEASDVCKQNMYFMNPPQYSIYGSMLYGDDRCLMPIPPEETLEEVKETLDAPA